MRDTIAKAAATIHEKLKAGNPAEHVLAEYEALLSSHPDQPHRILSQRAYSWGWLNEPQKAVDDLLVATASSTGGELASNLNHLARRYVEMNRFQEAEPVLARLAEVEREESSTYFLDHALLLRAYCLACTGRSAEALLQLSDPAIAADAEVNSVENIPRVTPQLVRDLAAAARR
jgi:tetratricopeptide (TPR) repeat protein